MLKKIIFFMIIITFLLFTLTGCYDSNGIEDFYYIVALGIDKSEKSNLSLSIQIAKTSNSSEGASSQSSEYKIYTVNCDTIDSGISILNNYLNKKINLSHCSVIVFSEELAKQGISEYINTLANNPEIKANTDFIISSGTALDVLNKVSNSGENFSSRLYEYILTSAQYTGYTIKCKFSDFFSKINTTDTQATAIYIQIDNDNIQNYGIAVFKKDIMVGILSPLDTISHLIISGKLDSCTISVENPFIENSLIDLNLQQLVSPEIDINIINNTPYIDTDIELKANISSAGKNFDYTKQDNIKQVQAVANNFITNILKSYLYKISADYNSDIIGFGGILSEKYLTSDNYEKIHWNEIFKDSVFNVNVNTKIKSSYLFNKE